MHLRPKEVVLLRTMVLHLVVLELTKDRNTPVYVGGEVDGSQKRLCTNCTLILDTVIIEKVMLMLFYQK